MLHPVLLRQLRKCGLNAEALPQSPSAWPQFLEMISRAYAQADQDRSLMDRAMELSTSEMSQLHAALASRGDDLEKQVQLRTAQLSEAKTAAEASSRAKSEFLATMSHEIRTPLNGVIGMIDLVACSPLDPRQKQYLDIAKSSAWSLTRIIGDVLDFSKIEAGKLEICPETFDLRKLIHQTLEQFQAAAQAKGLALQQDLSETLPALVRGDPNRLRQILVNLIGNAIKFTARGSVSVHVRAASTSAADGKTVVHFSVTDTGIGITDEQKNRLFQAFSQADSSTTRQFGGTGLGLVICKRLAALMGGEVGVTAQPGVGSTFWFTSTLEPLAAARVEAQPGQPAHCTDPAQASINRAKFRVLIADDNEINQLLVHEILAMAGYRSDVVDNGVQAVEAALTGNYDLILMDCQMPDLDGFQATEKIRQTKRIGTRLPIIALTANAVQGDRERCLSAGMDDYLSKPIDAAELIRVADRYLCDHACQTLLAA
jgi:signal transduction histidine kinase/ActR/RegA family two-component response regulator